MDIFLKIKSVTLRQKIVTSIVSMFLIGTVHAVEVHSSAGSFEGNATPTKYVITVSKVEFHKSGDPDSTYTTFVDQTADWDIASVSAGASIGTMGASGALTAGTYDKVRFTVSKTMTITASAASLSDSLPCRTESAPTIITDPLGDGSISAVYQGERDGGAAEPETMVIPTGSSAEPSSEFTDLGTSFRGTLPITFTVTAAKPTITIKFDVTNAAQFVVISGGRCIVFPGPPSVAIDVT